MDVRFEKIIELYGNVVRFFVYCLAVISSLSLLFIVVIVIADVTGRALGHGIKGSVDYVRLASAIVLGGALPYTTAVKGHIAIEFLFLRLSRSKRVIIDSISRIIMFVLFVCIVVFMVRYGISLYRSGEVTSTVQIPIFWIPFWLAICFFVTSLIKIYHLLRPGRELIKP